MYEQRVFGRIQLLFEILSFEHNERGRGGKSHFHIVWLLAIFPGKLGEYKGKMK